MSQRGAARLNQPEEGSVTICSGEIIERALVEKSRFENQHLNIEDPRLNRLLIAEKDRYAQATHVFKGEPIAICASHRVHNDAQPISRVLLLAFSDLVNSRKAEK